MREGMIWAMVGVKGDPVMQMLRCTLVVFATLTFGVGIAFAREATTTAELAMRSGPGTKYELLLTMPAGAAVQTSGCARGWCRVSWNSYSGFVSQSGLALAEAAAPVADEPEPIPIYPDYPYHSGHYPTADSYHDLPPYAALRPSYYRWRYFMTMDREWNRYRYVPYQFHGFKE